MKEWKNSKTLISTLKLEDRLHSPKITSFFCYKSRWQSQIQLEICIPSWVYVCIKIESYIHKIHKIPKSSGWCLVSKHRLAGFHNSFHDFKSILIFKYSIFIHMHGYSSSNWPQMWLITTIYKLSTYQSFSYFLIAGL